MQLTSGSRRVLRHGGGAGGAEGSANQSGWRSKVLPLFSLGVGPGLWAFSPPAHLQLTQAVGQQTKYGDAQ